MFSLDVSSEDSPLQEVESTAGAMERLEVFSIETRSETREPDDGGALVSCTHVRGQHACRTLVFIMQEPTSQESIWVCFKVENPQTGRLPFGLPVKQLPKRPSKHLPFLGCASKYGDQPQIVVAICLFAFP